MYTQRTCLSNVQRLTTGIHCRSAISKLKAAVGDNAVPVVPVGASASSDAADVVPAESDSPASSRAAGKLLCCKCKFVVNGMTAATKFCFSVQAFATNLCYRDENAIAFFVFEVHVLYVLQILHTS